MTDTLATALAADKQYARAIELEKQALAKSPNAAVLKLSLAKIYLRSGDKAQARRELEALLESRNDSPQRREASELLKGIANSASPNTRHLTIRIARSMMTGRIGLA